jgi:hypothetical protein
VVYAIAHASFVATIEDPGFRGGRVELYIGPEHDRTVRELEILVERFDDGREAVIFHVMSWDRSSSVIERSIQMTDQSYKEYAARLTDPSTPLAAAGSPLRGVAASAAGQSFLVEAYGSEAAVNRAMRRGRPRVGQAAGSSPEVRGRIMPSEFDALEALAKQTGRSRSDLVREGIHLLLQKNKLSA